ncbi:hypothetical protein FAM8407_02266 [Lacticaseibacillus paracasei]|nr:hypothetical protein FAM18175_01910 [Lacticaseibacillus paracasei]RNE44086.1 hypothetical protein FAM8407_02266 [Lacticaseibacillus paracasei]
MEYCPHSIGNSKPSVTKQSPTISKSEIVGLLHTVGY